MKQLLHISSVRARVKSRAEVREIETHVEDDGDTGGEDTDEGATGDAEGGGGTEEGGGTGEHSSAGEDGGTREDGEATTK